MTVGSLTGVGKRMYKTCSLEDTTRDFCHGAEHDAQFLSNLWDLEGSMHWSLKGEPWQFGGVYCFVCGYKFCFVLKWWYYWANACPDVAMYAF